MKIQVQISQSNSVQSESATKKQQANAKVLFGTKGVTILTALEAASKSKLLVTAPVDSLLQWLKSSDEEAVAKYASSASGKKLVVATKKFVANKGFEAKLDALKAIKFTEPKVRGGTASGAKNKTVNEVRLSGVLVKFERRGPYKLDYMLDVQMTKAGALDLQDEDASSFADLARTLDIGVELKGQQRGLPLVSLHGTQKALKQIMQEWDDGRTKYKIERV